MKKLNRLLDQLEAILLVLSYKNRPPTQTTTENQTDSETATVTARAEFLHIEVRLKEIFPEVKEVAAV